MKVAVLGSGSAGNSTVVEVGETRVLVDAGFSGKDLERRLAVLGLEPSDITAIVVTHNHQDHTRGAGVFARRHGTPVYITDATRAACDKIFRGGEATHPYRVGRPFEIGPVRVEPFLTVHDAVDPVAVSLVDVETEARVGVATDLGRPTAQVLHALSGSDFLILEANHDDTFITARAVSLVGETAHCLQPRAPVQPRRSAIRMRAGAPQARRNPPRAPVRRMQSAGVGPKRGRGGAREGRLPRLSSRSPPGGTH